MSKAQDFFERACAFEDWEVEKQKVGENRIVVVTRGDEAFRFVWAPNATTGRVTFHSGTHRIGEDVEPYTNVKGALRIMAEPGTVRAVIRKDGQKSLSVKRLPFDVENDPDDAIIISLAGKRLEWRYRQDGESESGHTRRRPSRHIRITRDRPDDPPSARIYNFVDQAGSGFRSIRLADIVSVSDSVQHQPEEGTYADRNPSARGRRSHL